MVCGCSASARSPRHWQIPLVRSWRRSTKVRLACSVGPAICSKPCLLFVDMRTSETRLLRLRATHSSFNRGLIFYSLALYGLIASFAYLYHPDRMWTAPSLRVRCISLTSFVPNASSSPHILAKGCQNRSAARIPSHRVSDQKSG